MVSSHGGLEKADDGIDIDIVTDGKAEAQGVALSVRGTTESDIDLENKEMLYPPAVLEKEEKHSSSPATPPPPPPPDKIPLKGLLSLLALHASSSWNARTCEFAFYLFLIQLFPDTLVRTSLLGASRCRELASSEG